MTLNKHTQMSVQVSVPEWRRMHVVNGADMAHPQHYVLLVGKLSRFQTPLRESLENDAELVCLEGPGYPGKDDLATPRELQETLEQLFKTIKKLMQTGDARRTHVQVVIDRQWHWHPALADAVAAMFGCMNRENPRISGQVICIDHSVSTQRVSDAIVQARAQREAVLIVSQEDGSYYRDWQVCESGLQQSSETPIWRSGGVYLITGGLGKIGQLIIEAIAASATPCTVIISGRCHRDVNDLVNRYQARGIKLDYLVMNYQDFSNIQQSISEILARYGHLNGVLHCAGQTQDNFIVRKSAEEFQNVCAPKITGTWYLDQATKDLALDFMVLFSSVSVIAGTPGQVDYAAANGFMDGFAAYRNALVRQEKRHGLTYSINWPLWRNGGMSVMPSEEDALFQQTGMRPIETPAAITSLYRIVNEGLQQAMVLYLQSSSSELGTEASVESTHCAEPGKYKAPVAQALRELFADTVELRADKIDVNERLENYGLDSLIVAGFNRRLANVFGEISKTLLYEYDSLQGLADFFVAEYPCACERWINPKEDAASDSVAMEHTGNEDNLADFKSLVTLKPRISQQALSSPNSSPDEIAIIGIDCKFPEAENLNAFWENLKLGKNSVCEMNNQRWNMEAYFEADKDTAVETGKAYSRFCGLLDGFSEFDPDFFNLAPNEVRQIDPQERLILSSSWSVIEDAGYNRRRIKHQHQGRVGVFIGITKTGFELHGPDLWRDGKKVSPISSFASVANRVSWFMDFCGPSMPVDTMCSSSLTAIHLACHSLRSGECEMAIAGGVNLYLHPSNFVGLCANRMLSSDGKCRSFGAGGDGFVPGEGVATLLLKPKHQALRDGDNIYALICASTVNHGGKTSGYTVPDPRAQGELIQRCLQKANIKPSAVGCVEAHGTGTSLGDPIEISGLKYAFGKQTQSDAPCYLGSVKTNIGHLESAAGVAGIIKLILQLQHKTLVPSLHSEKLNSNIHFKDSGFIINQELRSWDITDNQRQDSNGVRIGAVSSFGAGGANAHVIVKEYSEHCTEVTASSRNKALSHANQPVLICLSARTPMQLRQQAQNLLDYLKRQDAASVNLAGIAYTLLRGREGFKQRLAIVAESAASLQERLQGYLAGLVHDNIFVAVVTPENRVLGTLIWNEDILPKVTAWFSQTELHKIAQLWVNGVDFDIEQISTVEPQITINLPTYPFDNKRYWLLDECSDTVAPRVPAQNPQIECSETELLLKKSWRSLPMQSLIESSDGLRVDAITCVFHSADVSASELPSILQRAPLQALGNSQNEALLRKYLANTPPNTAYSFVFLVGTADPNSYETVSAQEQACIALFEFFKLLLRVGYQAKHIEFTVVTCNTVAAPEIEDISPSHAAVHGLIGSLAKEYEHWKFRVLDIAHPSQLIESQGLALPTTKGGDAYFFRKGSWYAPVLERYAGNDVAPVNMPYRKPGVYCVIGGANGIGFEWSKHMVLNHGAKIVWLGRRSVTQDIETKIRELAAVGPTPVYISCDATQHDSLQAVRDRVVQDYGEIDGVVNSAIVLRDKSLANMSMSDFRETFTSSVAICNNLVAVFGGVVRDFLLQFSSIQSFGKLAGQCNYAAACNYKDAFARQAAVSGVAIKTLNWGYWGEIGVAPSALQQDSMRQAGQAAISPQQAWQALERLLISDEQQLAYTVVTSNVHEQYALSSDAESRSVLRDPTPSETQVQPSELSLAGLVKQQLVTLLGVDIDAIEDQKSFSDYGVDSIKAVRLCNRINSALGCELTTTSLFDHCTVKRLTSYLEKILPEPNKAEVREEQFVETTLETKAHKSFSDVAFEGAERDIAIIGLACRFAESENADAFWDNLAAGKDLVKPVTRWNLLNHSSSSQDAKVHCRDGSFLSDIDKFDPLFFNISGIEANYMDPQQRFFLRECWNSLEDAGYAGDALNGEKCGVYAGCTNSDYPQLFRGTPPAQATWGNSSSSLPARIAYLLDLKGPAVAVDTACSSSLVAVHLACQALWCHEVDMALAGGVLIRTTPSDYTVLTHSNMLSPRGRCHSFDARADGFVPGEGVAVVLLKRASDAIRDRDNIHAIIAGSGMNQDGTTNGLGAPSAQSQESLQRDVYTTFNIKAQDIEMVEAHGSGTALGDPIEFEALCRSFTDSRNRERDSFEINSQYCALGSVKTNVGHTTLAAGIAGLMRAVLSIKHAQIPPSLHFENCNPAIDMEQSPFFVNTHLKAWPRVVNDRGEAKPRMAAVNSFGMSGTNVHLVVREAIEQLPPLRADDCYYLIPMSARHPGQLRAMAHNLLQYCSNTSGTSLGDVSFTLFTGRRHLATRLVLVAQTFEELQVNLTAWLQGNSAKGCYTSKDAFSGRNMPLDDLLALAGAERSFEDTAELASAWAAGIQFDYGLLFTEHRYRRISLPTYVYDEKSWWVPELGVVKTPEKYSGESVNDRTSRNYSLDTDEIVASLLDCDLEISEAVQLIDKSLP